MTKPDEIEIRFPSRIPDELKQVQGLSDVMKLRIANKIEDGEIIINSNSSVGIDDYTEKCEMVIDILEDRSKFDKHVTIDEIKDILDEDEKYLPIFIVKIMKICRERSIEVKKIKHKGKTAYKI